MTQYHSGESFRRAMEERLRFRSAQSGISLSWLRKMVVFDRYLARLVVSQPNQWVIKGGYSIQVRLMEKARTTRDIDVLALVRSQDILSSLRQAGVQNLDDWFQFEVEQSDELPRDEFGGNRYHLRALLDGRTFEDFHLDVGIGDPVIDPVDQLVGPAILDFAGIQPTILPCYPISQQIAEKLHAYTQPHVSGESSRVKDFVDILLLAGFGYIESDRLIHAIHATFDARHTHFLPAVLPNPSADWSKPFRKLAAEVGLPYQVLEEATIAIKTFLNPVLIEKTNLHWDPNSWSWR